MSVYFRHKKYADHHIEKMYKTIEKHMAHCNKYMPIIGGDFNAELGLGKGTERKSVGRYILNEGNKRGDWLKSWLMLQDYTALNTMFRKTLQKQTSFVSPKRKEKQIDYILTKRRYMRHVKDGEANDMIHMGSDHRCVMATFLITMLGKDIHTKNKKKNMTRLGMMNTNKQKNINVEMPELEKRYQEIVDTIKKPPPQKEMKHMTQGRTQKHKSEEKTPQQQKLNRTLEEAEAKRSKEEA